MATEKKKTNCFIHMYSTLLIYTVYPYTDTHTRARTHRHHFKKHTVNEMTMYIWMDCCHIPIWVPRVIQFFFRLFFIFFFCVIVCCTVPYIYYILYVYCIRKYLLFLSCNFILVFVCLRRKSSHFPDDVVELCLCTSLRYIKSEKLECKFQGDKQYASAPALRPSSVCILYYIHFIVLLSHFHFLNISQMYRWTILLIHSLLRPFGILNIPFFLVGGEGGFFAKISHFF